MDKEVTIVTNELISIGNFLLFFNCLALSITGLKSFDNIIVGGSILYLVYIYRNKLVSELLKIDNSVRRAYMVFLGSIFVASILNLDFYSIRIAFNFFYYTLPFIMVYLLAKTTHNVKWGIYGYCMGLVVICLYDLNDYLLYDKKRLGIMFGHPNLDASMMEMLLPVCICCLVNVFKKKSLNKLIGFTIIVLMGIMTLYLTKSRGAILGFVLGFGVAYGIYCLKILSKKMFFKKAIFCVLIIFMGISGLLSLNNGSIGRSYDNERILLLQSSYDMWKDNKIIGVGLANWKEEYQRKYIYPQAKEPNLSFPHNVYAYWFSTTGLIGGLGFLLFTSMVFKWLMRNINVYSSKNFVCFAMLWIFLAISIHGLVDGGLVLKKSYKLFCSMMGMTVAFLQYKDVLMKRNF